MENHKIHVPNHQPVFHMAIEIVDIPIILWKIIQMFQTTNQYRSTVPSTPPSWWNPNSRWLFLQFRLNHPSSGGIKQQINHLFFVNLYKVVFFLKKNHISPRSRANLSLIFNIVRCHAAVIEVLQELHVVFTAPAAIVRWVSSVENCPIGRFFSEQDSECHHHPNWKINVNNVK